MPLPLKKNPQRVLVSGDPKRSCRERIGLMGPFKGCRCRERIVGDTLGVLVRPYCTAYLLRMQVTSATALHLPGMLAFKSAILSTVRKLSSRSLLVFSLTKSSTSSLSKSLNSYASNMPHSRITCSIRRSFSRSVSIVRSK